MPVSAVGIIPVHRLSGAPPPATFAHLASLAARMLNAPLAVVSLADGRTFASPARPGDPWAARRSAPLARTLCRLPAATGRPLVVADARAHPAVRAEPAIWHGEVAYAGVPVRAASGTVAGTLCVADGRPREWSADEVETLQRLAGFAALLADRRPDEAAEAVFVGSLAGARGRLSLRMLEKAVETMQIGVTITDADGRILYSNPAEERMHGYAPGELRGRHASIFAPPPHARPISGDALGQVTGWGRESVNVRKDGTLFPVFLRSDVVKDSRGNPVGLVTCCEDLTRRKELEGELLRNAFYDAVTGLPNRGLFIHRLEVAMDAERRGEADFAVISIGLHRLQLVSDSVGRAAADELLCTVASRVRGCLRPDALVAHVARDEFALLLEEVDGIGEPSRVAGCIQAALAEPLDVAGHAVFTGVGVGIALSYTGYERADDVLRDASLAMVRSRDARQGQYEVFDRDMHAAAMERLRTESDLRRALERGEMRVHYQPIVSLRTGRIAGFEALVRWEHPQRGLVLPDDFVPLAEETGLILPIGMWVLGEACRALRRWQQAEGAELSMAVNLSAAQFLQPDLVARVAEVLRDTGVAPETLELEITESVLMQHTEAVTATLHRLKALGVKLHIDDFGTGYSSLGYLHRVPLDALKIDRTFVSGGEGGANLQLVRTIVAMAHALGVAVVTEGIESPELLDELRELRCEFAQGYFFSRPLASGAIDALIATEPSW